jgi:hypothetical protein
VWRFHPSTLRGRYGEESEEGQDREEGQEDKSQEEDQVVFWTRADTAPPGQPRLDRTAGFRPAFLLGLWWFMLPKRSIPADAGF